VFAFSSTEERQSLMENISGGYMHQPTGAGYKIEEKDKTDEGKKEKTKGRTINYNNVGAPLDYSYMDLTSIADLRDREPVSGHKRAVPADAKDSNSSNSNSSSNNNNSNGNNGGGNVNSNTSNSNGNGDGKVSNRNKGGSNGAFMGGPLVSTGLILSYNELTDLNGLEEILSEIMEDPCENLRMIDLSHNKFTKIPSELKKFKNLTSIYLHANEITEIKEVRKLRHNSKLQKLSLNGNEVITVSANGQKNADKLEETRFYRQNIIWTLKDTLLKQLDMVTVTPRDRQTAAIWNKTHRR